MRPIVVLFVLAAPAVAQDDALNERIKRIHATLAEGGKPDLGRLVAQAGTLGTYGRESVADALDDPQLRLGWNLSAKAGVKRFWATPGAEIGSGGGGYILEKGPVEYHGSFDPESLSVTTTFELGGEVLPNGVEIKRVFTCTTTYPDKETYNRARGVDPSRWNTVRQVLAVVEQTAPWLRKEQAPAGATPEERIGSVDEAAAAAARRLRGQIPDMFEAATQHESVTFGDGWSIKVPAKGAPAAGVRLQHMNLTRARADGAKPVSFASTSVGFGLQAKATDPVLRLAKIEGSLSASLSYSDDPEAKPDKHQATLARMIRNRELEHAAAEAARRAAAEFSPQARHLGLGTRLLPAPRLEDALERSAALASDRARALLEEGKEALGTLQQDAREVYRRGRDGAVEVFRRMEDGSHRLLRAAADSLEVYDLEARRVYRVAREEAAALADRVGGVKFDVTADILRALDAGGPVRQAVLVEGRVVLVSLGNLGDRVDLGVSRVHGYVALDDDVVLIGTAAGPPLRTEDLAVALRWVWQEGATPACSLDPLPGAEDGPQYTRVEGVPKHTRFGHVMLEADYAMKRIMFGDLPSGAPGYRSLAAIARDDPAAFTRSRFWFYPLQPSRHQLQVSPSRDAALFLAHLEVRTEALMLTERGFAGAGRSDAAEEAARSFTAHFGAIARRHPIFAELRGLLDLTVLARLLRHAAIDRPCLRALAGREPPARTVRSSYPAVEVEYLRTATHRHVLQGGAELRQRLGRRLLASREDMQFLRLRTMARGLAASGEATRATDETALVITPMTFRLGEVEDRLRTAVRQLSAGAVAEARAGITSVLTRHPDLPDALALRAICALQLGDIAAAEQDVGRARAEDPTDEWIRGLADHVAFLAGRKPIADPRLRREIARAAIRRAQLKGSSPEADADIALALRVEPRYAPAYYERALRWQEKNRFHEALDDWEQVVECAPEWFAGHTNRAIAKLNTGDKWGAIDDATTAIGLAPDHFLAYWARGTAKTALGDAPGAIEDLSEAIGLAPGFAASYRNRALAKFGSGDEEGWAADLWTYLAVAGAEASRAEAARPSVALAACERVLAADPDYDRGYAVRGLLRLEAGDPAGAAADFDAALARAPQAPELRVPGAKHTAAMKRYVGAVRRLEKDRAYMFWSRARAHARLGRAAEARADRAEAVRRDPALGAR